MVRGLYTAATGMNVQRNKMDVLTNNVVNAETTGYKTDSLITSTFDEVMLNRINDPSISILGSNAVGGLQNACCGAHHRFHDQPAEQLNKYTDLTLVRQLPWRRRTDRYTKAVISASTARVICSAGRRLCIGAERQDVGPRHFRIGGRKVTEARCADALSIAA